MCTRYSASDANTNQGSYAAEAKERALRSSVHRGDGEFLRVQWESHCAESSSSGCIVLSQCTRQGTDHR